ncbi:MAG: PQQ-dependent sugar dehydrogenase, partial [Acidobacteriota bacterium]
MSGSFRFTIRGLAMRSTVPAVALFVLASTACGAQEADPQATGDPFPEPIEAREGVIEVDVVEFASIPDVDGEPARMHTLVHEPGTDRIFLSDQRGILYELGDDGSVTEYLDVDDERWGVDVDASWREQGVQSFALHPQFAEEGAPGYGKIYVWTDVGDTDPEPDFRPGGGEEAHHTVLYEFTASDAQAATYDGDAPRELARFEQPFANHNGGGLAFNPLAGPDDPNFGMLYVGVGDGGSGGDPLDLGQDPSSAFGKVLRIDPLGSDGRTGEYGIPADNPFVDDDDTLDEIYLLGLRNPQQLAWDEATGDLFVSDIGQNTVEEVSRASAGDNLGWRVWEGSFRFVGRDGVRVDDERSDPAMTYPVVEYDQQDPLFGSQVAVTGLHVVRNGSVPALEGRLLFGDMVSGE